MKSEQRIVLHSTANQWFTGLLFPMAAVLLPLLLRFVLKRLSEGDFPAVGVVAVWAAVAFAMVRFLVLRARSVVATPEGLEIGGWKKLEAVPWSNVSAIENLGAMNTIWCTRVYRVDFNNGRAGFSFIGRVGIAADLDRLRAAGAHPVAVSSNRQVLSWLDPRKLIKRLRRGPGGTLGKSS